MINPQLIVVQQFQWGNELFPIDVRLGRGWFSGFAVDQLFLWQTDLLVFGCIRWTVVRLKNCFPRGEQMFGLEVKVGRREAIALSDDVLEETLPSVFSMVVVNGEDFEDCQKEKHSSMNWICCSTSVPNEANISDGELKDRHEPSSRSSWQTFLLQGEDHHNDLRRCFGLLDGSLEDLNKTFEAQRLFRRDGFVINMLNDQFHPLFLFLDR